MTTQGNNTYDYFDQIREAGFSRGWDHANFVNAYGGDMHESPNRSESMYGAIDAEWNLFVSGYQDGVAAYRTEEDESLYNYDEWEEIRALEC